MLIHILLKQIAIMALLMAVGYFLDRKGFISEQGAKDLGAILLKVIIPCVIVRSCLVEYSSARLVQLLESALLALIGFVLAMLISWFVFGKRHRIENFSAAFCNAGFIGIPLAQAVIGQDGAFFIAASIAFLNLFQWTYGVYILTDDKSAISFKVILKNPVVISIVVGVLLFVSRIPIPEVLQGTLGHIANMNTPVAMILMGTYLAKLPWKQLLDKRAYLCVLFRLVVIPLVCLLAFRLVPVSNPDVATAAFLAAITPVGANICVFASRYDCDYKLSVVTVCLSTVLSVVTIPLLFTLSQLIL